MQQFKASDLKNLWKPNSNSSGEDNGQETKAITEKLLTKFPDKKWVVDAGSLQIIDPELLPKGCIITPNKKEFELLFGANTSDGGRTDSSEVELIQKMAEKYQITIVLKGPETIVASPSDKLFKKVGTVYNADDLAEAIPSLSAKIIVH